MAYNIGAKIPKQKNHYVGVPGGPKSSKDVIHLIDLREITDSVESLVLIEEVLRGAQEAGNSTAKITFRNVD